MTVEACILEGHQSANYPSFSIANGNLKNLNYALQECVNFT